MPGRIATGSTGFQRASQGQFTIGDRESNNPQIKRVRVVSTVEHHLSD